MSLETQTKRVIRGAGTPGGVPGNGGVPGAGGPPRAAPAPRAPPCPASSQGIAAPAPGPCLWRACDRDGSSSSSGTLPRQVGQEPRQVGQEPKEPKMQTSFSTTLSSLSSACACACLPQPAVCVGEYAETLRERHDSERNESGFLPTSAQHTHNSDSNSKAPAVQAAHMKSLSNSWTVLKQLHLMAAFCYAYTQLVSVMSAA